MKKEKALLSIMAISASLLLGACTNPFDVTIQRGNNGLSSKEISDQNTALSAFYEEHPEIIELIQKEQAEGLSLEEYEKLATLYEENSMMKAKRDTLEDAYRLYQDQSILDELNGLSVNGLEESEETIKYLDTVLTGMASGTGDLSEAADVIDTDEFFETLMPKLKEGRRTYFYEKDEEPYFVLTVGYSESGEKAVEAYFFDKNTKTCYVLQKKANQFTFFTEMAEYENLEDVFNRFTSETFEKLTIDSYSGVMKKETGSLKDGKLFGDYEAVVYYFDNYANDKISTIVSNMESFTSVVFKGTFDENGKPTVEALSDKNAAKLVGADTGKTAIAYAYTEDLAKCLFKEVSIDEKDSVIFEKAELNIKAVPTITKYDTAKAVENNKKLVEANKALEGITSDKQLVKIVDSKVMLYQDGKWVEYANLSDLVSEDPFLEYNSKSEEVEKVSSVTTTNIVSEVASIDKNKVEETNKNTTTGKTQTSTSKPATSTTKKPATATTTPTTQAPAQTQTPATQPSQGSSESSGGSSGGGSSDNSGSSDGGASQGGGQNVDSGNNSGDNSNGTNEPTGGGVDGENTTYDPGWGDDTLQNNDSEDDP